jgi:NADH:ubiquinone oxidoreductase subunit E
VTDGAAPPDAPRTLVLVCHGPSCSERGSVETCRLLREAIAGSAARRSVRVSETGCLDSCATGPNVLVASEGAVQTGILPANVPTLVLLLRGPTAVD